MKINTFVTLDMDQIDVEVEYHYDPAQPEIYPDQQGIPAMVEIISVLDDQGADLMELITVNELKELENYILDTHEK